MQGHPRAISGPAAVATKTDTTVELVIYSIPREHKQETVGATERPGDSLDNPPFPSKQTVIMFVQNFILAMLPCLVNALYNFAPENASTVYDTLLPTQYSLPETQFTTSPISSYWFTSYLTTSNKIQFVLLSQALVVPGGQVTFRSSILDVADPRYYWQHVEALPFLGNSTDKDGKLAIEAGGFTINSPADDSIAEMVTSGSTDHYDYNLTVRATSRVLLNAGTGYFAWGNGNTSQWSLPSCHTSGTIRLGDTVYEVDPENSMTWYDRQFGYGGIDGEFTWFGVQFPGSDVRASIWVSDNEVPEQRLRFATVRTNYGLELVRCNVTNSPNKTWTSPNSNYTYQTKWFLDFDNGDFLEIESVRDDQEIYGESATFATSAFADVKGQFLGQRRGFALIDIVPPTKLRTGATASQGTDRQTAQTLVFQA